MPGEPPYGGWEPESYYEVRFQSDDGRHSYEFDLVVPPVDSDLTGVRLSRRGGDIPADEEFRRKLYPRIGAVTAAGGRAETAMRRLLVVLATGAGKFGDETARLGWGELEQRLTKLILAKPEDERLQQLSNILDWAKTQRLQDRRNDVIHAEWWEYAGLGVVRCRFPSRGQAYTQFYSFEALDSDARQLAEFARRLDYMITPSEWAIALLPRTPPCSG